MSAVTLDASVWIAAADATDVCHSQSRELLLKLVVRGVAVSIPAFAVTEVACALARRMRDAPAARQLTVRGLAALKAKELPMDAPFIARSTVLGTDRFLRGADALYAATAELAGSTLISWDGEHQKRAGALSPADWLAANP